MIMKARLLHILLRILFGVVIVISFFFLRWWAILAIIFVAGITPIVSMLFYSPFKNFLFYRPNIRIILVVESNHLHFFYYII